MLSYKGQYTEALVFIDNVEEEVVTQLYKVLNHPAFKGVRVRIMPDTHAGKGCVVGFTATMNDYIIPNLIGVDIGCGMLSCNIGNEGVDLDYLDHNIRSLVPSGPNIREKKHTIVDLPMEETILKIGKKVEMDLNRALNSVGTLGGGNHFIEIGEAPNGDKWITIHSGSRKFGEEICKYHQKIAKEFMQEVFIGSAYKDLEFLTKDNLINYMQDMKVAVTYAQNSRKAMMFELLKFLGRKPEETIESIHNYIDDTDKIIRKGATPAHEGQRVIIPFNMRDGIAICTGKGNAKWNLSAPHGAGRILSRKKAKEKISMEDYKSSMEGIFTSCVSEDTLDESPFAYKDTETIMEAIKETVNVDFLLKPIYNFKAS